MGYYGRYGLMDVGASYSIFISNVIVRVVLASCSKLMVM